MSDLSSWLIDLLVVAVIVASSIYATYRGFVSETLSIFAWAAAAFATLYFGGFLVQPMRSVISSELFADVVAYGAVFLVVLIPLSFMSFRFSEGVKNSPVSTLDRSLGLAFGVVRGLAIIGFAYLIFTMVAPINTQPRWITEARLLPLIRGSSEVILSLVPNRNGTPAHEMRRAVPVVVERHPPPHKQALAKPKPVVKKHAKKAYGADDRRALDRLIEATGGKSDKP